MPLTRVHISNLHLYIIKGDEFRGVERGGRQGEDGVQKQEMKNREIKKGIRKSRMRWKVKEDWRGEEKEIRKGMRRAEGKR